MKFSTRARYGMRALVEIGQLSPEGQPVRIAQISLDQDISKKYLESLLVELKKGQLVESRRGRDGGYRLSRKAKTISVYDIVSVLDGPPQFVDCNPGGCSCERMESCATTGLWKHLSMLLSKEMKKIKLSDLISGKFNEDMF